MKVRELREVLELANPEANVVVSLPHQRKCEHRYQFECRQFDAHFNVTALLPDPESHHFPILVNSPEVAPALSRGRAPSLPRGRM